ncbi:hypothetical protein AC579_4315 [Pseudocercospora musae]|uniref:EamA domain-containing protein n=1 Tax=Pseudocercospora musae TaxID=113226 RepID=A0A139IQP1_9PEZI|nr:hypothetical protein AC579_4315 [Pseudocercospora musae]
MSRLAPPNGPRKSIGDNADQQAPFLEPARASQEDDIELDELEADLGGERTPVSHYRNYDATYRQPPPKKKVSFWLIALTLAICVLGFVINTEATAYVEDELGWKKPFATMYVTHSSLALPWILHISYLRFKDRKSPYMHWVRDYNNQLRGSIAGIDSYATWGPKMIFKRQGQQGGPLDFLFATMAVVTVALTVSGMSWFTSLSLTTPADLTAIYNCSTFFAAAFSVPILKEKLGWMSIAAVAISIAGTFTIAYGDTTAEHSSEEGAIGASRLLGNIIACVGALAFGLYEVLFKKFACSSRPESQESSLPLTLAASAMTGFYTFVILWVPLIPLHILGWEVFVLPTGHEVLWIIVAVLAGSLSLTLLAVLVIWTDPVFGSMANVLSVFFVALADWLAWGIAPSLPTYIGGAMIFVAFGMLGYDTLGEKKH